MRIRFLSPTAARLATLALLLTPVFPPGFAAAYAQGAVSPSPAVAATQLAVPVFRSAFEGYQPYTEQKMAPWKEANDNVGQIGGWREYAREASQPDTPDAPAKAAGPATPKAGSTKP